MSDERFSLEQLERGFARTRLNPPLLDRQLLERPRLLHRLGEAVLAHQLTLISAPAGSGKTTLAAALQNVLAFPIAWLTLDREDNDPVAFLTLAVLALRQKYPDLGTTVLDLLGHLPDVHDHLPRLLHLLINDILSQGDKLCILVLDDFHLINDPAVHDLLAELLDHAPPQLHLVLTSRYQPSLPLSRWRVRGQLAEFLLPDLRFDDAEAASYYNQRLALGLASAEVVALQARTEGWIAGMRLLAMTLNHLDDSVQRSAFIDQFSLSNRLIFDLLADEVLAHQPPDLREFLLQTSILTLLTPTLCTAVTTNAQAPLLLEDAYRRNLFLTAVNEGSSVDTAYRYHDLFAVFLQRRLEQTWPHLIPELHQRAAAAQEVPERAIYHLVAARRWDDAANRIEQVGRLEISRRFIHRRLIDFILALPEPLRRTRPWLYLILGIYNAHRRDAMEPADALLQKALSLFRSENNESGQIEVLIAESWRLGHFVDRTVLDELALKIDQFPSLFRPDQIASYHASSQWNHLFRNYDWDRVTHHFLAGIELARQTADPGAIMTVVGSCGPVMLLNNQGLAPMEAFIQWALALIPREPVAQHLLRATLSYIHFYRAEVDQVEALIGGLEAYLRQVDEQAWIVANVLWMRLSLLHFRRDFPAFASALQEARSRFSTNSANVQFLPGLNYLQGRAAWERGDLAETQACLAELLQPPLVAGFTTDDEIRKLILQGLLALSDRKFHQSEQYLRQAAALHHDVRHTFFLHDPRLALATLYYEWHKMEEALTVLEPVLREVRQKGMPGILLQEGDRILPLLRLAVARDIESELLRPLLTVIDRAAEPCPLPIPGSTESLSPRETEVLRLIMAGASNRDIATDLVITERTVKAHVTHILSKLGVRSRTQAVSRSRELRLL